VELSDIERLHEVGRSADDARDFVAVAAMFVWANRLMRTLGQPVTQ
jgi:hypothetical protein